MLVDKTVADWLSDSMLLRNRFVAVTTKDWKKRSVAARYAILELNDNFPSVQLGRMPRS